MAYEKTILCYGDSNSWGLIPGKFNESYQLQKRLEKKLRWPKQLKALLGKEYEVIEANLCGRNTSFDEIPATRPSRNGLKTLPHCLEMHYPIDLIIFMLGTNDTRIDYKFNASVEDITRGMRALIQCVKQSHYGRNYQPSKILLIAPPPLIAEAAIHSHDCFDHTSIEKSLKIGAAYQNLAEEEHCAFVDAGQIIKVTSEDGVHIEATDLAILAKAVAQKIQTLCL